MRRYTTPTLTIIVEGIDLTAMDVRVTLKQGKRSLTISNPEMEAVTEEGRTDTKLDVTLTQEQTALFEAVPLKVQVNFIDVDGARDATECKTVDVWPNLLPEVIAYGL